MRVSRRFVTIGAVVAILLCSGSYGIIRSWEKSLSCSATPPRQAMTVGYMHVVFCDAFKDNHEVDVDNTLHPQFLLYPSAQGFATPASSILNHGAGLQLNSGLLTSVAIRSSVVGGNTLVGGFYAEVDMKFNSSVCIHDSELWPAFWFNYAPALVPRPPPVRFTELDAFEWLDCRALGTVHDWPAGGGPHNCQNSNDDVSSSFSPGNGWNSYGILLIPSASGRSGRGMIRWYYNNRLMSTVTYSRTGFPDPPSGCPRGAFATSDTQPWAFTLYGGVKDLTVFRNLHIYQAPAASLFRRISDWLRQQR